MNRKIIWLIFGVILVVMIFIVISSKRHTELNQPIKIAALLSLTGDGASWGESAQKAIQLATEEINKNGGINGRQVDMIYEDTAGDPKKAVSAYQLVTSIDHVVAIIGPLTQTELTAIIPLINKDNIPTVAPDYIPLQNRTDLSNPLLVWMDAQIEASRIAQYAFSQGIRSVGILGTQDSWETTISNAFADEFKSLGGTVTDMEIVQPTSADMKLPVTKIVATKPQAIFIGTYYQFVNSTKELHDLGYGGKLFSIEVDDYLAGQTSSWVKDLQFIAPDYYTSSFTQDFKGAYGTAPGLPAGQSYDATNLLFQLIMSPGVYSSDEVSLRQNIVSVMSRVTEYDGVSGQLEIAPDGRTTLPTALFDLKKGTITRVQSLP